MQADFDRVVRFQEVSIFLLFEDQMDDLSDVAKRFIHRLPLAVTTLEERTLYYVEAIFILRDGDRVLPVPSFCLGTFVRASHTSNRTALHGKNQMAALAVLARRGR